MDPEIQNKEALVPWYRCQRCKGSGSLEAQLYRPATCEWVWAIFSCPNCRWGYIPPNVEWGWGTPDFKNEHPYGTPRERLPHQVGPWIDPENEDAVRPTALLVGNP